MKITFQKISGRPAYLGAQANKPSAYRADTLRDLYIPGSILLDPPPSLKRGKPGVYLLKLLLNLLLLYVTAAAIVAAIFILFFVRVY